MGLSCEIPMETMSLCIHDVPTKFECGKCISEGIKMNNIECIKFYNEQRLKELELQIKALTEMYKDLSYRVAGFSDHRIRQIDENRKVSRRVDYLQNHFADIINSNIDRTSNIESTLDNHFQRYDICTNWLKERLTKLEKYIEMEDRVTSSDVLIRLNELEKKLNNIDFLPDLINRAIICFRDADGAKPHKCPVCDGRGEIHNKKLAEKDYQIVKKGDLVNYITECKSCEGKGIIWG